MTGLILRYAVLIFVFIIALKKIFEYIKNKNKIKLFLKNYFNEDKLYNVDDIAYAFKLDKEHLLHILETLENYNYFNKLKKNGVSLVKDYYSLYEIKIILKIITKRVKL